MNAWFLSLAFKAMYSQALAYFPAFSQTWMSYRVGFCLQLYQISWAHLNFPLQCLIPAIFFLLSLTVLRVTFIFPHIFVLFSFLPLILFLYLCYSCHIVLIPKLLVSISVYLTELRNPKRYILVVLFLYFLHFLV